MPFDFTPSAYERVIDVALAAGYRIYPVSGWFDENAPPAQCLVLRHDVDRSAANALVIAEVEARKGIRATYYFRIIPAAFVPDVVRRVAQLGHEIGYHYEDFQTAGYEPDQAYAAFASNLERLRQFAEVRTITAHDSPLRRRSNTGLWKHHRFEPLGVRDCVLSHDWSSFTFFTDTGRSFNARLTNLRDALGGTTPAGVRTSEDVARYLSSAKPARVHFSTHPERWNATAATWLRQYAIDMAANAAKLVLRTMHSR